MSSQREMSHNVRFCSSSTLILLFVLVIIPNFSYTEGSKRVLSVVDYGAKGDGQHDDTKAFQEAWKIACSLNGGAVIFFPYGKTFLVYPLDIVGPCRSKVTLLILGEIVAPEDPEAWNGFDRQKWLSIRWVSHLTVEGGGSGTINGMGHKWWSRSCKTTQNHACGVAPTSHNSTVQAINFHRCYHLKVKNLKLLNSQQIHVAITNSRNVVTSNLRVLAPAFSPNTDGIHIGASKGVEVNDCIIQTGDDCISIVSNSSKIRIRNLSCGPGHGISIGSLGKFNSWEKVHDVTVDGAFLSRTGNGVRIKTWQGGGGFASDITFRNILMDQVSNPITVDQYYCDSSMACQNQRKMQSSAVKVRHISFINIRGTSASENAIKFACSDASPCEDLLLENIFLAPRRGGLVRSYCWEAHGFIRGPVQPSACPPVCQNFIGPEECQLANPQMGTNDLVEGQPALKKITRAGLNQTVEANSP
ncbi:probable polygalacturonase At1g80170 isoform X2 [Prosopis cineraria]|uniref:probable polygalacturonase At1g80170 isoform X2 n=1 Tax=Prosopis cineraria TaxID=364024 RepID=UPI00240FBA6D|nr:probable polygalacturonase At1g80170 isoform X2 [Prosopis cineraria]XP_054782153.1 probable polygalacturonase At1g80170 isoform X2 [Prosopis cineraria]